ncbi:hypothetical protein I6U48_13760 [Clostridium sp. PL3]|uniref:Uroporphyrinogen decarboxylase (URO-D) domain-containing protein n=1 Tax=Clostridium thailandense TaxID=2794346 RepID=A0A949TJG9_9CLOT|nr:uroporphyrinogen decarboxylase family protein [Clostridium thailandense]MBV7273969.1 hypothetical protein [Clostridium thailandense]
MSDMQKIYDEKVKRIVTTSNHQEPDRVPVLSMFGTWAISYAGGTVQEMADNPEKEIEYFCKPHEDIYSDATYTAGLAFDAKTADILGTKSHFISDDGTTVQHHETCLMETEEYPELISDPMGYTFNKLMPRKCANLNKSSSENYETLKNLVEHWKVKGAAQAKLVSTLKEKLGVPVITGNFVYPPMDAIFDYYRGFKGTSLDMRRNQKELQEGVEALFDFCSGLMGITPETKSVPEFPFYATMMHMPTFMNPKQFEKFFWPTYEKMWRKVYECGGKLIIFLEGNWENKYEFLNSFPKNFALGILEGDDVFKAKKLIGDNMTIVGGMPMDLLRVGTKEKCIDYAKKVVDECAPGGGYIFASTREMLSKGDVNVENLKAVNQFVHEYGIYK